MKAEQSQSVMKDEKVEQQHNRKVSSSHNRRITIAVAVAVLVVILIIAGALFWRGSRGGNGIFPSMSSAESGQNSVMPKAKAKKHFAEVYQECDPHVSFTGDPAAESLILEEGNQSLTLLSGKDSDHKTYDCVMNALEIPSDLKQKIRAAKMSDGLQEAAWGDVSVTWSYNDNTGLDLTLDTVIAPTASSSNNGK